MAGDRIREDEPRRPRRSSFEASGLRMIIPRSRRAKWDVLGTKVSSTPVDPDLLTILRCPLGQQPLVAVASGLECPCGLTFPVRDGIPVLILAEATPPVGVGAVEGFACAQPVSRGRG